MKALKTIALLAVIVPAWEIGYQLGQRHGQTSHPIQWFSSLPCGYKIAVGVGAAVFAVLQLITAFALFLRTPTNKWGEQIAVPGFFASLRKEFTQKGLSILDVLCYIWCAPAFAICWTLATTKKVLVTDFIKRPHGKSMSGM